MPGTSRTYGSSQSANDRPIDAPEQNLHAGGLSIRTDWLDNVRAFVVYVTGNIDWTTAHDLRFEIAQCLAFDCPAQLVVDLAGVDRVDSSGVGSLVEGRQNANKKGVHFALCSVNASLRRVLERIRLDTIFEIRATTMEALRDTSIRRGIW